MSTDRQPASSPNVFGSLDAMLTPAVLGNLLGTRVKSITQEQYVVAHRSANQLYQIRLETESGRKRLILKEFQPHRDWVMRLTHDTLTREAMLYRHGVYAAMPPEIVIPILAVARHGDTWACLMWDVSADLLAVDTMQSETTARLLIHHLAVMHAHFWNSPALSNSALGLSSLEDFITVLAPSRVRAEIDQGRAHPVVELAARGWREFEARAPADVVEIVQGFQQDPATPVALLQKLPKTLVHGDYKIPNLGIDSRGRAVVLDWQDATLGPAPLDLGYFLALNAKWLAFDAATLVEMYRTSLADEGHELSREAIELGLVCGGALRLLWLMVLNSHQDLEWWYDMVRRVAVSC